MSNISEDYCRRDRLSYRQSHPISGAASATDRYHLPNYEASSVRHLPVFDSAVSDSRRLHQSSSPHPPPPPPPPPTVFEKSEESLFIGYVQNDRYSSSSSYDATNKHSVPPYSAYDVNDHRLPPLPPSPNHYTLDSEEPFIPPPDRYLSPPAPAPPDRYQSPQISHPHDRFFLSSNDLYLPPASSTIDKYKGAQTNERIYDRYSATDRYGNPPSPPDKDRYETSILSAGSGDSYIRRDLLYHNHYRLANSGYYHLKPNFSAQRSLPAAARPSLHSQHQNLRFQKCCFGAYHSRDGSQMRDISSGTSQSRIRSNRTSSPVSFVPQIVASTIPVDFASSSSNNGRYLSSPLASTLPRCNSFSDMQGNPSGMTVQTLRRAGHENCCFKRRTSSPSSSSVCSYAPHSANSFSGNASNSPSTTAASSLNSQTFSQSTSSSSSSSSSTSSSSSSSQLSTW